MSPVKAAENVKTVTISPPNLVTALFHIVGEDNTDYCQHKFSAKAQRLIREKQEAGSTAKKGAKREARDFAQDCKDATYLFKEGWYGIPAPAFRNACISACRLCGFKMTIAKMTVFVIADGVDAETGKPLVRITKGKPRDTTDYVRLETGVCSITARPKWATWEADVRIRFDADQFKLEDVTNLLSRAGMQVGIGEGRPDSPNSSGQGWGTFRIASHKEIATT